MKMRALLAVGMALVAIMSTAFGQVPAALPADLVNALRFTIREIRVEGNILVSDAELQQLLKPFLGSGRGIDDLSRIRNAILDTYRARDLELLSVNYDGARSRAGVLLFVVHEIRLGKVRVTGNQEVAEAEVRRQLPGLVEGTAPRLGDLARQLFLFNDNPGRSAGLEYSRGGPGVTDVEIQVRETPQQRFAATLNNTGSVATGVSRLGLNWNHYNLFGRSHQVAASVTTSPERPERVFIAGLSYLVPLPALGDQLAFLASHSDVDSGRVADVFNVSGKGTVWGVHYLRNLARTATSSHKLDVGYDERRYRDTIDFFGTNLGVDVTARPLSAGYRYGGLIEGHALSFAATLQQNIAGGERDNDATYAESRAGAKARWQSWQFEASWQRELASGWMPTIRLAGQYAREPLISAEQFGLGGLRGVRGFEEREGAGDRGWRANLELYGPRIGEGQRLLGFVDAGHSTRLNSLPGERASEGVSSYGLGWRAQFASGIQAAVDVARVANGTPRNPAGDWMLHVSAAWFF